MPPAARGVLILQCSMPTAVINYIIAARYERHAGEVAGVIVTSTLIAFAPVALAALVLTPGLHDGLSPIVKGPWYFLGLQEMLVYFDPWIAGVVMPTLIIIGLMVIPYVDTNPLGAGYYGSSMIQFLSQISEANFQTVQIQRKEDIWPSFKTFLAKDRVRDDAA